VVTRRAMVDSIGTPGGASGLGHYEFGLAVLTAIT
jgi:hypothetical protein